MKLAIMQPYLFPYLGYFQLVAAVDRFVFLDDVNFINRGWINRNRLLFSGEVTYFTVPLVNAGQNRRICDIAIVDEARWKKKLEESIRQSYAKAPNFEPVYQLIATVMFDGEPLIGEMAKRSVVEVAKYLDLPTQFVWSTRIYENPGLTGEARIRDICQQEHASAYYNLPGGQELYGPDAFAADGIALHFIEPNLPAYPQFAGQFHPGLSIVDVLMHVDRATVRAMLQ